MRSIQGAEQLIRRVVCHREVGVVPYAVQNGKMPVGVPQAGKQRRKNAKAAAVQLCAAFERTGQCPDPHCRFAHGSDELAARKAKAKCVPTLACQLSLDHIFSETLMHTLRSHDAADHIFLDNFFEHIDASRSWTVDHIFLHKKLTKHSDVS